MAAEQSHKNRARRNRSVACANYEEGEEKRRSDSTFQDEEVLPGASKHLLPQISIGPLLNAWKQAGKDFKMIHRTLRDIARLQEIFSGEVGTILTRMRQSDGSAIEKGSTILMKSWRSLFNIIECSVKEQRDMGEYISNDLVATMSRILKEDEGSFKKVSTSYREVGHALEKAKKNVRKAKQQCQKEDDRAQKYTNPEDVQAKRDEAPKTVLGWGKKLVHSVRHAKETNEDMVKNAYERARTSEVEYKQAISDANQAQYNFTQKTDELKNLVHATIKRRAKKEIKFMKGVAECYKKNLEAREVQTCLNDFEDLVRNLSEEDIVKMSYHELIMAQGPMESTDKKFEVEFAIRKDCFHSLIDAKDAHETTLPFPKMLHILCQGIKELDGFQTQGIFRISGAKTDVDDVKNYFFENSKVDGLPPSVKDPHIAACVLKDWLRGLDDALIPSSHYDWIIDTTKAGAMSAEAVQIFLATQIPALQKKTIIYLVTFLKELLNEENVAVTKMTLTNIAIVFGPTLLRSPHEDPQTLLESTPFEKQFVEVLIRDTDLSRENLLGEN